MPRIFFALVLLFITVGCTHTLETKSGYKPGQYAIKQFEIKPVDQSMAIDPEYIEAKERISQAYAWEILGGSRTPEASLTMTILDVSFEVNAARAMLVGDGYRLSAKIELRDIATQNLIAEDYISEYMNHRGGVLGIVVDAAESKSSQDADRRELIRGFTSNTLKLIYPNGW